MKDYKLFFMCAIILTAQDMSDLVRASLGAVFAVAGWAGLIMDWNKK